MAGGDFTHRIEVNSGDEMEDLAAAFNDMTQRLRDLYRDLARQVNERSRQLVRSERLASVGFLAAGVAHEINNPLASIAFCSEALEARLGEPAAASAASRPAERRCGGLHTYLKMIQEEAFRCKDITERLLEFSRSGEQRARADRPGRADPVGARHDAALAELPRARRSPSRRGVGQVHRARSTREEIKSVVLNLVVNALDSMDEGGR